MQKAQKFQVKLILLLIISLLPAIGGWFLYHYQEHFRFKTLNRGILLNPAVPMEEFADNKQKLWKIVYAPSSCCDSQCQKTMFTLHQLRKVLGKDSKRVTLTLVTDAACQKTDLHDFNHIEFNQNKYAKLQTILDQQHQKTTANNKIYLIDPIGNLFMYYASTIDAMNILKDLKRVLEVSQIG
jgi:hypothetical protein